MLNKILSISFFSLLLFCQQRDLSNPFDPENEESYLNIDLILSEINSAVKISWITPNLTYNLAEIYRYSENQDTILLASLDGTINSFLDTEIAEEIKYSYYLKLIGNNIETKSTKSFSIIIGPGDIWITDDYLFEILKLNYDTEKASISKNGLWKPENICFAHSLNKGLITYPSLGYFEIFDLNNGNSIYFANNQGDYYPFDAVYDPIRNHFWMIDSSGTLHKVDTTANATLEYNGLITPVQIDLLENDLFILDVNAVQVYNITQGTATAITQNDQNRSFHNIILFRLDKVNRSLYILDKLENISTIYKYEIDSQVITAIISDTFIRAFDINQQNESIWIVTSKGLNFELVQLSNSGERLLTVPKDFSSPRYVRVNPYNGNVIVTEFAREAAVYKEKVFHFKSTELIGTFKTYGDPHKVYIE